MPALEVMDLVHRALLWTAGGFDSHGAELRNDPIEVRVRWEYSSRETQAADNSNKALTSQVKVDRAIPEGATMWRGTLDQWNVAQPLGADDPPLMAVVAYDEVASLCGRFTERWVTLAKRHDALPAGN